MTLALPEAIAPQAPSGPLSINLTNDHRYRNRALAVPGAYWHRDRGYYVADNPTPRAAAAIIALFPEVLIEHPELHTLRERDYGDARPHDYASEVGLHLDVALGGQVELYDWQASDLGYLRAIAERDGGAFVGWDRGLGKTIATAALMKATSAKRTLIVTRNDTKEAVWQKELARVLPEWRLLILPNEKKKRDRLLDDIADGKYDGDSVPFALIIHYEAIALIAGSVTRHERTVKGAGDGWRRLGRWNLMAFDEGHRLASYNPNSRKNTDRGRGLSRLRKHVDLAVNLTGSSIMNHPEDLFGQLHYLFPNRYRAKWADWNDRYIDYVKDGDRPIPIGFKHELLPQLRRELGVFMVYRTKAEVFDLPPLIRQDIELKLVGEQRRAYEEMRDQFWTRVEGGGLKAANPLSQLNLLRRIATYMPGLPSAKLDFTLRELEESPDEQFVVFTWYKEPGHRLAEILGDDVIVVDGDVPIKHRPGLLRAHEAGRARVLVGSIATLGESLNLQYMHEAIRLDRDWNPQVNQQTEDRLNRNGQQARVTFRDLWTVDTIDTLRVRPNLASKESLRKAVFG